MEIYGEYLFIENFISGIIILLLTAKISGKKVKRRKIIIGGIVCGLFSFVIFLNFIGSAATLIIKLLFSILIISYVFGLISNIRSGNAKQILMIYLRILLTFYIISFLMGGTTLAILYFGGIKGISNNGYVYVNEISYLKVALGIGATFGIGLLFVDFIKRRVIEERLMRNVTVYIGNSKFDFMAYIDSGNALKDPSTGKPVAVISRCGADKILNIISNDEYEKRFCAIPYRAVGTTRGIMEGVRVDRIEVRGNCCCECLEKMVLAIYEGELSHKSNNEAYEILLNKGFLEGGIAS